MIEYGKINVLINVNFSKTIRYSSWTTKKRNQQTRTGTR